MNFEFFKTNLKTYTIPLFIVIVDQLCKSFIFSKLFIEMKIVQINFFLNLIPVWNNGISFGMFNDSGQWGSYFFTAFGLFFGFLIPIITKTRKVVSVAYLTDIKFTIKDKTISYKNNSIY